jgi:hypothetical protein
MVRSRYTSSVGYTAGMFCPMRHKTRVGSIITKSRMPHRLPIPDVRATVAIGGKAENICSF